MWEASPLWASLSPPVMTITASVWLRVGAVCSTLCGFFSIITFFWKENCPYFTAEEIETQRSQGTCSRTHNRKAGSVGSRACGLTHGPGPPNFAIRLMLLLQKDAHGASSIPCVPTLQDIARSHPPSCSYYVLSDTSQLSMASGVYPLGGGRHLRA